tara:strand:- start:1106 stop:2182 length:1077 start_codon:yes stop_codon:yes gene_type:complete
MTVDFIFDGLNQLFPEFAGNDIFLIIAMLLPVAALLGFITVYGFGVIYSEIKVSSFIQDKTGPMGQGPGLHAGKWGLLQPVADGIKLFIKEDIIPASADKPLFILAPFLIFIGALTSFIAVPFGEKIIITDMNIGIFYIIGVGSLAVIALILAGWSSNNKWALFGGMRSAAQIISYEIPAGISLVVVIMIASSLNMQEIIAYQAGGLFNWIIFDNPFMPIVFIIFFISVLAETNRTPFDLPESESELVAGFVTEYSGTRYAIFFLSEYANMFVVSAVAATAFLGGWQSPFANFLNSPAWGVFWMMSKTFFLIFVMIWVRWTVPRLRVDQLMHLCWKVFIPIGLFNVFAVAIWIVVRGS